MRIGRSSSFLGIAISDRAIGCAQVAVNGQERKLVRAATFDVPPEMNLEAPQELGASFASFLRENKFDASRAIVGVPARWLIAVQREIPPADERAARALLRLQAERIAVAENGEVTFDFAGEVNAQSATKVLLVGMLRSRLEHIEQLVKSAGMSLGAVTSSALALTSAMQQTHSGATLLLARGGGEMVWRDNGSARMLRHVPFTMNGHGAPPMAPLGAELRRAVAMAQAPGASRDVMLLDGVGLDDGKIAELAERLGAKVDAHDPIAALAIETDRRTSNAGGENELAALAPAMSLALAGAKPHSLPVDFLHSRLAPEPKQRVSRRAAWAIALGATAVIALLVTLLSLHQRQTELDDLRAQLKKLNTSADNKSPSDVADAREAIERLRFGRGFFSARPPALDCLRELTLSFRDDEHIWARSFSMSETGNGTLTGKAADQKTVLALLSRLQKNEHFRDVKLLDSRESDSRSREVTYSISFVYKMVD